jgi:NAD-dependent DNA ligase
MSKACLAVLIKKNLTEKPLNIEKLREIKNICDIIHETGENMEFEGVTYTYKDLPSDMLYEELIKIINREDNKSKKHVKILLKMEGASVAKYVRKDTKLTSLEESTTKMSLRNRERKLSDTWMGKIIKPELPEEIENGLLMPKFDGCSCCCRFIRNGTGMFYLDYASTRGNSAGFEVKTTVLTNKMNMIVGDLIEALNSVENMTLDIMQIWAITFRGEVVVKDKDVCDGPPAAWVAGKVNGGNDVWENALENIEYIPFEITRIYYTENEFITDVDLEQTFEKVKFKIEGKTSSSLIQEFVPTQLQVIEFINSLNVYSHCLTIYNTIKAKVDKSSIPMLRTQFEEYKTKLNEPVDGVVYCDINWKYPQIDSERLGTVFGKYAWKPSSEFTTKITGIEYSISRDGKFNIMFKYEPRQLGGKTYSQAKSTIKNLIDFKGIGVGSVVTIKLCNDISPSVEDYVVSDEVTPFEILTICPYCGEKTVLKVGKLTTTLSCSNKNCSEINRMKIINLLDKIKFKGIGEKTIQKLTEPTLECLVRTHNKKPIMKIINDVEIRTLLLGLGYTKTKIDKGNYSFPLIGKFSAYKKGVIELLEKSTDLFVLKCVEFLGKY